MIFNKPFSNPVQRYYKKMTYANFFAFFFWQVHFLQKCADSFFFSNFLAYIKKKQ